MRKLDDALEALNGSSRHDNTRDNVLELLFLGKAGHRGVKSALEMLGSAFVNKVAPDRDKGRDEAVGEFRSFFSGAVSHNYFRRRW